MTQLSKYLLHEPLGRGSYGTVYHARDQVLDVPRAVKVLHPPLVADPDFVKRFRDEARLVARLKHPHIVPVYDLGQDQGRIFLAMEYYPGGSFKDHLVNEGPLPFPRAVALLEQIASALDYAHQQGILHRDLKPQNILLDAQGNAALTDFGFAKALSGAGSTGLSSTGGMIGTPAYMPPEVWDGKGWTSAADVYSLACVFFEMITGKVLFEGESPVQVMKKHVLGPQLPTVWPEGCPMELQTVMEKGLAENVETRFASAGSLVEGMKGLQIIRDRKRQDEKSKEKSGVLPVEKPLLPLQDEKTRKEQVTERAQQEVKTVEKRATRVPVWGWIGIALVLVFILAGIVIVGLGRIGATGQNANNTPEVSLTTENIANGITHTITPNEVPAEQLPTIQLTAVVQTPIATSTPSSLSPSATPTPRSVTQPVSCTLSKCDTSTEDVCVYSFAPQINELMLALKFKESVSTDNVPYVLVSGEVFDCAPLSSYPDRLYCTGPSISGNTFVQLVSVDDQTMCTGSIDIPKYVTPVPTPKNTKVPDKNYP